MMVKCILLHDDLRKERVVLDVGNIQNPIPNLTSLGILRNTLRLQGS